MEFATYQTTPKENGNVTNGCVNIERYRGKVILVIE